MNIDTTPRAVLGAWARPALRLLLGCAYVVVIGAASGCSDDENRALPSQPDAGFEDTDTSVEPDTTDPGDPLDLPASVEILVVPARATYQPDTVIQTGFRVYDGRGALMSEQPVTWSVAPAAAATAEGSGFRLNERGPLTFQACTVQAGASGQPVCGEKQIIVAYPTPAITLTKPEPGAWLGTDGSTHIEVEGKITDALGPVHAFVNGREVTLDANNQFSTTLSPHFGTNHIEVLVSDGISSTSAEAMLDVIWAPAWYEVTQGAESTSFRFNDGLVLDLGQRFFDDGQAPLQTIESAYQTNDLADILALLIRNIDFMDQIPNPVIDSGETQLNITSLTFEEPTVAVDLTDTGVEIFIWVPGVEIGTQGSVSLNTQTLNLDGSISTDLAGVATLSIEKPGPGQGFISEVKTLRLSLQNAHSNFSTPEANALFALAESALRANIEVMLADTLSAQLIDPLPDMLTGALDSIEAQLSDLSFDLETEFTAPLTLGLGASIYDFDISYRDTMRAVLASELSADKPAHFTHSPGIPLAGAYQSELPLFHSSRAQVGLRLGLLNGLLHTLWATGFLEIELTDLMPEQFASIVKETHLSAKLQPILTRPRAGEPYDFILSAGQMEIQAELLSQVDTYAINIEVGVRMNLADNAISLTVPDEPRVIAWVKSSSAQSALIPSATIESLVLGQVWPQIEQTLQEGLSFELPLPSMDGLSGIAPSLSALQVEFLLSRPISYRDGFIILDAELRGTLPVAAP